MREDITIRPETPKDYKDIVSMVLRSLEPIIRTAPTLCP